MQKLNLSTAILVIIILLTASCKKEREQAPTTVSQFVYDGLSSYYLWADEMKAKKPTATENEPQQYFKSLLNATDVKYGWSWLTDDVNALLANFAGEPKSFGFVTMPLWYDEAKTRLVVFIKYVFPQTPASLSGLERGNVIEKIDGNYITPNNYKKLLGAEKISITVLDQNFANAKVVEISPEIIKTDPVLYRNIYEMEGKKIGYLFYTGFIANYNKSLYNAFMEFQQAGITDLVLDLRYNHGGSISTASYLASLIAPRAIVQSNPTFSILSYNPTLNDRFSLARRSSVLGKYDSQQGEPNPLNANVNLSSVYIIATRDTYSASELITFCLRPFMNVVHIGENTGGKYTASFTLHAYDYNKMVPVYSESNISDQNKALLKNWAMQPIVAKYTDKNGKDFSIPGYLSPDYPVKTQENNTKTWHPIGNEKDYLFAKAISLITGKSYPYANYRSATQENFYPVDLTSTEDKLMRESVNIDNPIMLKNFKNHY